MPLMRLDKYLADCTALTRSQLRREIRSGAVTVNGEVITQPEHKLDPDSAAVTLGGEKVEYKKFCYYMLNKPAGILSATDDKKQRTVIDLFPPEIKKRGIFPVGRLDKDTTGLLIITDDGELAHKVISPKSGIVKTYIADTDGAVTPADVKAFAEGVTLKDGTKCLPAELEPLAGSRCIVRVSEGKYHQVKRMLASVGKPVLALKRVAIGALELDKTLAEGEFRPLGQNELCNLYKKK